MSVTQSEAAAGGPGLFGTQEVSAGTPHVVGRVEEVPPGEGRAFVVDGVQVAVFRLRDGSLHATQAACPHAGGPLADGQTDLDVLVCPLHLYTFRWTDGTSPGGAASLRVYPVHEESGQLVVTV
ncbi:Rieske (2Fe-2S) protein [Modestobacter muralis]|uniref:Rieske (2Fe-2S) protein n=1 Tax=Modestobacter muralis TaxID=1608614 RepID=A0A6P0EWM2_9ACTN|nr:Rieske (2Fe-2S) protein [Modestobacter muralis]NEK96101.1 Rieske (2Fe-2S) protein [Modestobacter muralis]NEN52989.1 Rieske (2Fe-2S) protein [Modestobacter muralis]